MRIAYLECFSGMSGDMFLGALVDAGVPARVLEETVAALEVGVWLEISRVVRSGISATKVDVWVAGEKDSPRDMAARERIRHIEEKALRNLADLRTKTGEHGHAHAVEKHGYEHGAERAGRPLPHEQGQTHEDS